MKNSLPTRVRSATLFGLICLALLQLAACACHTARHPVGMASKTDSRADKFVAGLSGAGYSVGEGSTHLIDPAYYVNYNMVDSAAGNNAGQPYKRLQIPPPPKEVQDTADRRVPPVDSTDAEKTMGVFRLAPNEAVVYLGLTPPKGDYFSFTPFLWSRQRQKKEPVSAKSDWIFAALGDPLNNRRIKTEGGGNNFQQNTLVIFTADETTNNRIKQQAKDAGYTDEMINTYVIPSKQVYLGNAINDDTFLILVRAANMYDVQAANSYNNNDHYARVFRVTPKDFQPLKPLAPPRQQLRHATTEEGLVAITPGRKTLEESLDALEKAIISQTPNAGYKAYKSSRWFTDSSVVLMDQNPKSPYYHQFVAGEASDTPYLRTSMDGNPASFPLGPDDLVVVFGVNHEATGLATYSNFSVYSDRVLNPKEWGPYIYGNNDPVWSGVAGMGSKDSKDPIYGLNHFAGSARHYLPDDPNTKYLYAVRVLRTAPADHRKPWVVVPEPTTEGGPASGIDLNDNKVFIGYRAYVNPQTGAGPAYEDIVHDRAIWFKLK